MVSYHSKLADRAVPCEVDEGLAFLFAACVTFAPNAEAIQGFDRICHDIETGFLSSKSAAKALASALVDGLTYGNWP